MRILKLTLLGLLDLTVEKLKSDQAPTLWGDKSPRSGAALAYGLLMVGAFVVAAVVLAPVLVPPLAQGLSTVGTRLFMLLCALASLVLVAKLVFRALSGVARLLHNAYQRGLEIEAGQRRPSWERTARSK